MKHLFSANSNCRRKKRKANAVLDLILLLIVLSVMGISSFIGMKVFDDVNTDIQADTTMTADAKNLSGTLYNKYPSIMDNAILLAFVLLLIFILVSVFMLDSHPIFFIIVVILMIAVFIIAIFLANIYDDIASDTMFAAYANQLVYTSWIMRHLLEVSIAVAFFTLIALFIKVRGL